MTNISEERLNCLKTRLLGEADLVEHYGAPAGLRELFTDLAEVLDEVKSRMYNTPEEKESTGTDGHLSIGARLVLNERLRQIQEEGFSDERDDAYCSDQLPRAAVCYTLPPTLREFVFPWPWDMSMWKPTSRISDLTKAGALIAAEIDRLLRALEGE